MGESLFVELLQVSLGTREELSRVPSAVEWQGIFDEAQRQAVAGILACGIERLPKEQQPPQTILLQWIGLTLQIEQRNALTTKVCGEVAGQMEKDGLRCCVLKGQANHRYYPEGMAKRRACGDVDIWTVSGERLAVSDERATVNGYRLSNGSVREVLEYVDAHWERTGLCWLHCNFKDKSGVPVEVHFHPSFFSRPKYNKRFKSYFSDIERCVVRETIDGVEIPVMRVEEDVIYQMNHIYRHLIDEGVGLRQVLDYYWLLRRFQDSCFKFQKVAIDREGIKEVISWLGMWKFAGALMYVLKELLGMPEKYLLCEPSEKDGKFLMEEILMSGNFGHGDPRMGDVAQGGYMKSRVSQAWRRFKRNMRFLSSYPGEVIWEPVVRVQHFAWKHLWVRD